MGRIRLTQIFPCLLPLRKKQKIFCYYIGMRLDHNRYSETRSDTMLANPLFYADWPLYNYETGYELIYQENKAYNCSLAARVLDKVIIAPGETFSFWNAVRDANREVPYKNGYTLSDGKLQLLPGGGLCQMSSFLYWLFMHTPLTVTEQHTHGIDLHRNTPGIPQGIDAAVAEGRLDLRVKNNTAYTFQIQISVDKYHMRGKVLSDAKLFLIKLQEDGRRYSTVKTVRGVLRPAFQMAVDDDVLIKNPFGFELAGVVVNDTVTREAITKDQMRKFLKFVRDDNVYCKYYEAFYILFHTGMRISEFCGLTIKDIDLENNIVTIDHQLLRTSKMEYIIQSTKTNAGTRKLPITEDVAYCFRAIIEDRPTPKVEKFVDGYSGFLYLDKDGMPEVAMHWQHRFNHAVQRYNDIYRVQMPNITPHVCRHTYCSNMAKAGMNPKTLQYLMGHSDIGVTMNTYTHLGLEDAKDEMIRMEELNAARAELNKTTGEKPVTQKMFRAI